MEPLLPSRSHSHEPRTMDEGAIEPLDVVVPREGQQHLVADDGEGQEKDSAQGDRQGEGAQLEPGQRRAKWLGWHRDSLPHVVPEGICNFQNQ